MISKPILESEVKVKVILVALWPSGLYSPWNSPGQNTGVGSCSLLQGIFPTQRLNPCLPHCRQILCQLNHKGSPRILKWVAYPFSSGSSHSRNQTGVSCTAGGTLPTELSGKLILKNDRIASLPMVFDFLYFRRPHATDVESGESWK